MLQIHVYPLLLERHLVNKKPNLSNIRRYLKKQVINGRTEFTRPKTPVLHWAYESVGANNLATKATTEGVVRFPSLFAITTASLPSITETQLLVVPKSIPIIFPIFLCVINYYFLNSTYRLQLICQRANAVKFWQTVILTKKMGIKWPEIEQIGSKMSYFKKLPTTWKLVVCVVKVIATGIEITGKFANHDRCHFFFSGASTSHRK